MGITVGIDATRSRSGGAKAHLIGILNQDPSQYGIDKIHVWSYDSLLEQLPEVSWLIKHSPPQLKRSIFSQLWWQYHNLSKEVTANNCDILLNPDAGTVSRHHPCIVMSQDMLSFEENEITRYKLFSKARLRLFLLRYMQANSLKCADGAVFLTNYAEKIIQQFSGKLKQARIIPHGVGSVFAAEHRDDNRLINLHKPIRCLYVSNAAMYKHQWSVVKAVAMLRDIGYEVTLTLVGGGNGRAKKLMDDEIARSDPNKEFVETIDFIGHDELSNILSDADIFIFASSCENMPVTLIEAMASGLPIACSDRGPMPEVLQDSAMYFDPENSASICKAVETLIKDVKLRVKLAKQSKKLSAQYSWERCAGETWQFLADLSKQLTK